MPDAALVVASLPIALICSYIHHLMLQDRVHINQTSLLPAHNAQHIPVGLYAARRVYGAVAFSDQPAEETDEVPDIELH